MREILSRLRAALPLWFAMLLAAAALLLYLSVDSGRELSLEERAARVLSGVDGAGRVDVTIRTREIESGGGFAVQSRERIPCGAVAVAQGADDPLVAMALHDALCALLGLPPSCVSVISGGK